MSPGEGIRKGPKICHVLFKWNHIQYLLYITESLKKLDAKYAPAMTLKTRKIYKTTQFITYFNSFRKQVALDLGTF